MSNVISMPMWKLLGPERQLVDYQSFKTPDHNTNQIILKDVLKFICLSEVKLLFEYGVKRKMIRIRPNNLWWLYTILDLTGLEYRNKQGDLIGVIQAVSKPRKNTGVPFTLPSDVWVHYTGGCMSLPAFGDRLNSGDYVCLPGCSEHGDMAMIQAFKARLQLQGCWLCSCTRSADPQRFYDQLVTGLL
jgi:hypothetical protein